MNSGGTEGPHESGSAYECHAKLTWREDIAPLLTIGWDGQVLTRNAVMRWLDIGFWA
jgi:hypothetical protein